MEVTSSNNQGPVAPRRQVDAERIDITRINRDGIRDATEDISEIRAPLEPYALRGKRQATETDADGGDRIELSEEARKLLAHEQAKPAAAEDAREARLAELRQMYVEGRLNTRERVDQAASEMLSAS